MPDVTSILVNFNSKPAIDQAVKSLINQEVDGVHRIVVWENGDDREVSGVLLGETREFDGKQLCHAGRAVNLGYAGGVQAAWATAVDESTAFVHLANPDTVAADPGVLRALAGVSGLSR